MGAMHACFACLHECTMQDLEGLPNCIVPLIPQKHLDDFMLAHEIKDGEAGREEDELHDCIVPAQVACMHRGKM